MRIVQLQKRCCFWQTSLWIVLFMSSSEASTCCLHWTGCAQETIINVIRTSEGWLCFLTPACSFLFLTCLCPTVGCVSARSAIAGPSKGRDRVFVSPETSCFRISRRSDALPIVRNHSGRNSQGMRSGTGERRVLEIRLPRQHGRLIRGGKLVGLIHFRRIDNSRK